MTRRPFRELRHTKVIGAPPEVPYELIDDVSRWPVIFAPSVHVRHLEKSPGEERFRLWAVVGGEVRNWVSRRELDRAGARITFEQERTHPPIEAMQGRWTFRPLPGDRTEVVLDHRFSVAGGDEVLDTITDAVHRNSEQELDALARIAELGHPVDELIYGFSDTIELGGASDAAYEFVNRSDLWPQRLPHVDRVELTEDEPGIQHMEMDTRTADGSTHTTRSVRICCAGKTIAYKQQLPPSMLFGHSGEWRFAEGSSGAVVTASHTVGIDPAAARRVLGEHSTLADAQRYLREALGGNGRATLEHARDIVQSAGPAR